MFEWIVLHWNSLNERWFLFVWEFMHDQQWIYSIKFINFCKLSMEIKIQEAASYLILLSCLQIIKFTHALREFFFNLSPLLPTYHNFLAHKNFRAKQWQKIFLLSPNFPIVKLLKSSRNAIKILNLYDGWIFMIALVSLIWCCAKISWICWFRAEIYAINF